MKYVNEIGHCPREWILEYARSTKDKNYLTNVIFHLGYSDIDALINGGIAVEYYYEPRSAFRIGMRASDLERFIGIGFSVFINSMVVEYSALGSTLGTADVNISRMTVGSEEASNQNVILLNTDTQVTKELLSTALELDKIDDAMALELPVYDD